MWSSRNTLATVEIVYYLPALVLAASVSWRHGFSKQLGWLSLIIFSIFRIVGSSLEIGSSYSASVGLYTAAIIIQSFGLASLLISIQGLLNRLNTSLSNPFPVKIFRLLHMLTTAGIALLIAGAVNSTSNNASDSKGHVLERVGMMLLVCLFLGLVSLSIGICLRQPAPEERPIKIAIAIVLPLLAIRLVYSILTVFDVDTDVFSLMSKSDLSVIAEAVMATLEEFAIVAVLLVAGFTVPLLTRKDTLAQSGKVAMEA